MLTFNCEVVSFLEMLQHRNQRILSCSFIPQNTTDLDRFYLIIQCSSSYSRNLVVTVDEVYGTHLFYIISVYKPHRIHPCHKFYIEGTQQHQPCSVVFSSVTSAFTKLFVVLVTIATTADNACHTDAAIR